MLPIFRILSVGGVSLAIAILILALIPPGGPHLAQSVRDVAARGALIDSRQHPEWRQFLIQAALKRAGELEHLRALPGGTRIDLPVEPPNGVPRRSEPSIQPSNATGAAATDGHSGSGNGLPKDEVKTAGLPSIHFEADPEDVTGSIDDNPGATMPMDIGETSSTELPVSSPDEMPPVTRMPMLQTPDAQAPDVQAPEVQAPNLNVLPPSRPAATVQIKKHAPRRMVRQRPRNRLAPAAESARTPTPPPFNILEAIFRGLANPQGDKAAVEKPASKPPTEKTSATPARLQQVSGNRAAVQ